MKSYLEQNDSYFYWFCHYWKLFDNHNMIMIKVQIQHYIPGRLRQVKTTIWKCYKLCHILSSTASHANNSITSSKILQHDKTRLLFLSFCRCHLNDQLSHHSSCLFVGVLLELFSHLLSHSVCYFTVLAVSMPLQLEGFIDFMVSNLKAVLSGLRLLASIYSWNCLGQTFVLAIPFLDQVANKM